MNVVDTTKKLLGGREPSNPDGPSDISQLIGDERFTNQLLQVQSLKNFLFEEKVRFDPEQLEALDLGLLNNLRHGRFGRAPSSVEWKLLDEKLSILASYLNPELRQRIRIRELGVFFGWLPLLFLLGAVVTVVFYHVLPNVLVANSGPYIAMWFFCLIAWTLSQGGLGACAFLGTRVAIKQVEVDAAGEGIKEAADITDRNVLKIRVVLGCLFAFLLGLPFSSIGFDKMGKFLFSPNNPIEATDLIIVFVPFLIGFSTNLVLAILDRCVISIRTFFGISASKT